MQQKAVSPRYKWEMIALLWVAFFLNQGDRQIFNSVIPLIREDLGLTDVQLGLVVSIFTILYGLLVPVAGFIGDAVQKRWIVFLSLFTFSVGTLLTGAANGLILLIIFRSVATGAGEAFYYPASNSMIGQYHKSSRAQAMAIHQTGLYTGIIVGGWLAGWIGQTFGWRMSFFTFGAVGVVWAVLIALRFRNDRADAVVDGTIADDTEKIPFVEAVTHTCNKPTLWLLSLAFGAAVFVHIGYVTWMPTLLYEKYNLSLANAGFSSMFYHHVAAYVGVLVGARISDLMAPRRNTVRMETEYFALLLASPFIFLTGMTDTLWIAYVGLAGFGFFRGGYDSNLFAALFDVIEPKYRSTATGIMLSVAFIIGSLSPVILGWIKEAVDLGVGIALLGFVYSLSAIIIIIATKSSFQKDYSGVSAAPHDL